MSILTDLTSTLDRRSLTGIGSALGESEQNVSRGMQPAMATVLGGLASKAENPNLLRRALDLAPAGENASLSTLISGAADPNSSGMTAGKHILSTLFGSSEGMIAQALSAGTGLQHGFTSSLLAMAAPMVMVFLGRRVRDQGLSMNALGGQLQREVPAIRDALPAGVTNLLWPAEPRRETVTAASPVVAQTVSRERSASWLPLLLLLALIPALIWLFSHHRRAVIIPNAGTANRYIPVVPVVPKVVVPAPRATLPSNVDVYFQNGSSRLLPESQTKLDAFAQALRNNPTARVSISGYTDSNGNATSNIRLSQDRANAVEAALVHRGIAAERFTAKGMGEDNPIGDNATSDGRQHNRRATISTMAE